MKKIDLNVTVKYSVSCEFDNVPDDIAEKLLDMDEVRNNTDVYDWLTDHVREDDSYDWEFEINNAEEMDDGE